MASTFQRIFLVFVPLFIGSAQLQSSELLKGDEAAAPNTTFSFPIGSWSLAKNGNRFFVGAAPSAAGSSKNFAFCGTTYFKDSFEPLSPEIATINHVEKLPNPIYDSGITHLSVMEPLGESRGLENPVIVISAQPNVVYYVNNFSNLESTDLLTCGTLQDAQGLESTAVVGLATQPGGVIYAAVTNNAGNPFGAVGSGIAELSLGDIKVKNGDKEQAVRVLAQMFAGLGMPVDGDDRRAAPLDINSPEVAIQNPVNAILNGTVVDTYWSNELQTLYIALQVQAGANAGDGARTIVVGKNNAGKLILQPFAPDAVFVDGAHNEIVGTRGANAFATASKIRVMATSTRLFYLIIFGGNGDATATRNTVYAVPLVNNAGASTQGTLASINAVPEDVYINTKELFAGRLLPQPALTNADATLTTYAQAQVGRGALPAGIITDMFVQGDTVFAVVGAPDMDQQPGIFASQALLDAQGKIKDWTEWQRVSGSTDTIFGGVLNGTWGQYTMISGSDAANLNTVKRTLWSGSDSTQLGQVARILGQELPFAQGGIQGLFDFPYILPGMVNSSMLIATGLKKIVLVETGEVVNNVLIPNAGDFTTDQQTFSNGTITQNMPPMGLTPRVVSISGGALDELGAITCAEIVAVGNRTRALEIDRFGNDMLSGHIAVGGVGGVAILTLPNGDGWDVDAGLGPNFLGLTADMGFVKIGDYSFVRKLICTQNYLYVLTNSVLDRIDVVTSNFGTGALDVVRLATASDFFGTNVLGSFLDVTVSQKLALLATSNGLYRSGNNVDVASAVTGAQDIGWTQVTVPNGFGPIKQLFGMSYTTLAQNIASNNGGQVYALTADIGNDRARLDRFTIGDASGMLAVHDTTVASFPDRFIKQQLSHFINFGGFRNVLFSDGAMTFFTKERNLLVAPFVQAAYSNLASGNPGGFYPSTTVLNLDAASEINSLIRSSASGSLLLATNNGLLIQE